MSKYNMDVDNVNEMIDKVIKRQKENRKEQTIKKYIDIVNNVIDRKRDDELNLDLMDGVRISDIIETIDKYEKMKEIFEKQFREAVTVKVKETQK